MAYTNLDDVKYYAECYIRDRFNCARVEIISVLQDMLNGCDHSIRMEAGNYLYTKQVEVMIGNNDLDINKTRGEVTSEGSNEQRPNESLRIWREEVGKMASEMVSVSVGTDEIETVDISVGTDEVEVDSTAVGTDEVEVDSTAVGTDEVKTEDKSTSGEVAEITTKEDKSVSTIDHELIQQVNAIKLEMERQIKSVSEEEIAKRILNAQELRVSNESKIVSGRSIDTYLSAIMKQSDSGKDVHVVTSSDPRIPRKQPEIEQPQQVATSSQAFIRTRPRNPTVFMTSSGHRIEIPILEFEEINPFIDAFADKYELDRGFISYGTVYANTRFKRACEAMKALNVTQSCINELLPSDKRV